MIGTSVERYKILEELGQGGMSVVYRGMDTALEREVAVKVLHNHLARKLENRQRFHREAKAIARLKHSNILEVYDYSSEGADESYIVMEYIPGENLRQFFTLHGTPPPEIAAAAIVMICSALEHAHQHGVIHRDLKPENVMVSQQGVIKLMDFGIAHVIDAETMTQTGSLLGSPAYMAPELIEGRKVDVRADIFSLGSMLYWAVTGKLPFEGQNAPQVLKKVLDGAYDDPELVEPRTGHRLSKIICKCLAGDPDERYATATEVRTELMELLAANGFESPTQAFTQYFGDPAAYTQSFADIIVPHLMRQGREALGKSRVSSAIHAFNRILAYDPDNEAVQAQLASIGRRSKLKHRLAVGGAVFALVGVVALVFTFVFPASVPQPDPELEEPLARAIEGPELGDDPVEDIESPAYLARLSAHENLHHAVRESATITQAMSTAARLRVSASAMTSRKAMTLRTSIEASRIRAGDSARVSMAADRAFKERAERLAMEAAPEKEQPKTTLYRFKVSPPAATLYIGEHALSAIEAARGVELTYGRHVITARSPGCKPLRKTLMVTHPQKEREPIVLDWEDSHVHVVSNFESLVWIDDDPQPHPIGAGGSNASIRIRFGRADTTHSEKKVQLRIAPRHALQQVRKQVVSLRPGVNTTLNVNFAAEN